jgi:hypothetical protein
MTPLLLGLALLAPDTVPIEDITAQFVAATQANHVACVPAEANIGTAICYGLDSQFAPVVQVYVDGAFAPYVSAAAPTTTPAAAPVAGATTFGDGMWLVGTDIAPGTYRTTTSEGCYYERLSDLSGDFDAIIDNAFVDDGNPALVEIAPTDAAFDSDGCGTWTPV